MGKIKGIIMGEEHYKTMDMGFMVPDKSPLIRLWVHRARKFLYNLVYEVDKEVSRDNIWYKIVDDTISCVLEYIQLKKDLKVYLYDICLACFWLKIQQYGLTEISINKVIKIAKKVLGHKVTHGKILRVMSYIKSTFFLGSSNPLDEVRKQTVMILDRMFTDRSFIEKKFFRKKMKMEDVIEFKLKVLNEVKELILKLSTLMVAGVPKKVMSAVILYMAFRKACEKGTVFVSSGDIEKYSGVCRFTILRKYKKFMKERIKA